MSGQGRPAQAAAAMARRVRPWLAPAMAAALGTAGITFVAMAPLSGTRLPLAAVLVMGAACLGLGLMWLRERARMRDLQQRMARSRPCWPPIRP